MLIVRMTGDTYQAISSLLRCRMVLITSSQHGSISQFGIIAPVIVQTLGHKPSIFRMQIGLLCPVDTISNSVAIGISPRSWTTTAHVQIPAGPRNYSPVLRVQARPLMGREADDSHLFPELGMHGIICPLPHTSS